MSMWKKDNQWAHDYKPMSAINITPMVDVMLVLLIIFMVAAPMLTQGVNVDLPDTNAPQIRQEVEPLVISIQENGDIFMQKQAVNIDSIAPRIKAMRQQKPDLPVFIRGDAKAPYEHIAKVMSLLESSGIKQISLVTEPQ